MFDKKVHLPLEEHEGFDDEHIKNYCLPNGMHISYSKKFNLVFINNVDVSPIDSWGSEWQQNQQCLMLKSNELEKLIEILQDIKNVEFVKTKD